MSKVNLKMFFEQIEKERELEKNLGRLVTTSDKHVTTKVEVMLTNGEYPILDKAEE